MATRNNLRKQVKALEQLAGLEDLTPQEARRTNGGYHHKKKKKHKKTGTGALLAKGTGALWAGPTSGGVAVFKGSGSLWAGPSVGS